MRSHLSLFGAGILLLLLVIFAGCNTDPCKELECANGGSCVDGACVCTEGYTGENCTTEDRVKYLGTFDVEEACDQDTTYFNCTISPAEAGVQSIRFSNFHNVDRAGIVDDVVGQISRYDLTIPAQEVGGITFSGFGTLSEDETKILMTFTYTENGLTRNCISTYNLL